MTPTLLQGVKPLQVLREEAQSLARQYCVFLVDHGRNSRSTHRFWWNHFEDACGALGIPCLRLPKASNAWPKDRRQGGRRGIYLYFTGASLYRDRMGYFSAARQDAIHPSEIIASWDPQVLGFFSRSIGFRIVFRSQLSQEGHLGQPLDRSVVWEPYAPLTAIAAGAGRGAEGGFKWDFGYFGTLNRHNHDQFRQILRPLARRYRCCYRGKLWRIPSIVPLRYGFTLSMVSEAQGFEVLARSRVNLVIHNDYHRRARSVTERLFVSGAIGRPVVCDNPGAHTYFTPEEIPVGEHPEEFMALCENVLHNIRDREEIARRVQAKVFERFTYLHTVVQFLRDIDNDLSTSDRRSGVGLP